MLPLAGNRPVVHSGSNRSEGCQRPHPIANSGTDLRRRPVRITGHVHGAGNRLGNHIISGTVGIRPRLSVSGNGTVDNTGVDRFDCLIAEAQAVHNSWTVTFNEDVRLRRKLFDGLNGTRVL